MWRMAIRIEDIFGPMRNALLLMTALASCGGGNVEPSTPARAPTAGTSPVSIVVDADAGPTVASAPPPTPQPPAPAPSAPLAFVDAGDTPANNQLPPYVTNPVVNKNFGFFRACYNEGLKRNPQLHGRVVVKFVLGPKGAVESSADAGSDLPDPVVVDCVVRGFRKLSFPVPQPQGGKISVVYPITFNAGDD
jgi:TonB family protein